MKSVPVCRRTRLQRAMNKESNVEKNRCWVPTRSTRSSVRKYANVGLVNEEEEDDDDDIMVVDEAEYNKRVAALKTNSVTQSGTVESNQDLVKDDTSKSGKDDDNNAENNNVDHDINEEKDLANGHSDIKVVGEAEYNSRVAALETNSIKQSGSVERTQDSVKDDDNNAENKVDHDINEEDKDIGNGHMTYEVSSDDSLEIIEEKLNSGYSCDSSAVTSSDSDDETMNIHREAEDEVGSSTEKEINENDNVDGGDINSDSDNDRLKCNVSYDEKRREGVSNNLLFEKRKYDGLVLPMAPENNASKDDFVGRRTRSHSHIKLPRKKRRDGTVSCPVTIDDSHSSSDTDNDDGHENSHKPDYANACGSVGFRKRRRPRRGTYVESSSEPENDSDSENGSMPDPENDSDPENHLMPDPENDSDPENHLMPDPENVSVPEIDPKIEPVHEPLDDKGCENVGVRKRGRPRKNTCVEGNSQPKNNFVHNGPILENGSKVEHVPKPVDDKGCESAVKRKRGPILENDSKVEHVPKPLDDKGCENVFKRKRGRPPKNRNVKKECSPPRKRHKLKCSKVGNILLNAILENSNTGWESPVCSVTGAILPLKFSFAVKKSLTEKTEEEEEIEGLFNDLDFALRTCDVGCCSTSSCSEENGENDDVDSDDGAVVQGKLCCQGKHYLILDDQIGVRCKYCSYVKLEMRYVTPDFDTDPFGRSNKNHRLFPCDGYKAAVSNGLNLPDFDYNPEHVHSDNDQGTVWDLVPGVKKSLYPHQQEAFEFIWRNVGGATKLDELGKPTNIQIGGCIICHAPGTGKTRLAITFLQSFIKKNPMSRPVIVSPTSMLLTWEEEFARWKVKEPFHNLNKAEPSGHEDPEVVRATNNVRLQKLCSWAKGKGILGISYRLFDELAGERKDMDASIKKALLEQPGILVLDEGHTPRNNDSNIWNVLTKVKTKRRIILSGTPFQNNFVELHNTLSLVREEFRNPLLLGNYINEHRKIAELRKYLKPFVHVHKGEILKKMLRGLYHSVVFLKPSDLQKTCCQQLSAVKYIIEENHLVSVACVHPSLLNVYNHVPNIIDKGLLEKHKENLEVGLKIKFLLELINLAVGEKILVFSQYLQPLNFIADLLKSRYDWSEGEEYLYMKGQQATKQRQTSINRFNDPSSEVRVLLASIKACGEGIHLVGASRVVLLDVVWNPSVERQAISRAYRIGQLKDVFVYHLILSDTLEENKYHKLVNKGRLSELVFSEGNKSEKMNNMGSKISKDRVLEEMIQNEKTSNMFVKIVRESGADKLIKSFNPENQ